MVCPSAKDELIIVDCHFELLEGYLKTTIDVKTFAACEFDGNQRKTIRTVEQHVRNAWLKDNRSVLINVIQLRLLYLGDRGVVLSLVVTLSTFAVAKGLVISPNGFLTLLATIDGWMWVCVGDVMWGRLDEDEMRM
ncbi:hypothetical protein Tco_1525737 [Tanacetum coccineum]